MHSDQITRVCYAAVCQYLRECELKPMPDWDCLEDDRRFWWRLHVERALSGLLPRDIHEGWYEDRVDEGWVPREDRPHASATFAHWEDLSDMYQTMYFLIQMNVCALTIGAVPAFAGKDVTPL